jgi:hypothetical protein
MPEPVILELAVNGATPRHLEGLGRAPATTAQARQILGVPFSPRPV